MNITVLSTCDRFVVYKDGNRAFVGDELHFPEVCQALGIEITTIDDPDGDA